MDLMKKQERDMARIKQWYSDLMSTSYNEILYKAKLVIAADLISARVAPAMI